jgi:hypothetical protein
MLSSNDDPATPHLRRLARPTLLYHPAPAHVRPNTNGTLAEILPIGRMELTGTRGAPTAATPSPAWRCAPRTAGFGTILVTGGGFADHPIPALATVSLGKAALRSAATMLGADLEPDGIRVATLTIAGQIAAGTSFDPERIAERYWEVVHVDGPWQAEFRFTGE